MKLFMLEGLSQSRFTGNATSLHCIMHRLELKTPAKRLPS